MTRTRSSSISLRPRAHGWAKSWATAGTRSASTPGRSTSPTNDYVFASRNGTGTDHRNIGGRVLARAVERAGLSAEEHDGEIVKVAPTFHSLRHSHGSALIASGWDLEEVSARLGHRDVTITARVYVHAYESAKRSAARTSRLEAMYGPGDGNAGLANERSGAQETAGMEGAEIRSLPAKRSAAQ